MNVQSPEDFANRLYLTNRRDFEPLRFHDDPQDQKLIERSRRKTFYEHVHAENRWARRHHQ